MRCSTVIIARQSEVGSFLTPFIFNRKLCLSLSLPTDDCEESVPVPYNPPLPATPNPTTTHPAQSAPSRQHTHHPVPYIRPKVDTRPQLYLRTRPHQHPPRHNPLICEYTLRLFALYSHNPDLSSTSPFSDESDE